MTRIAQIIVVTLTGLTAGMLVQSDAASLTREDLAVKEQRIDITIQDSDFLFAHPVRPQLGVPTVIVLRNQDIIQHGFTSSILKGVEITVQGEGLTAYGRGIEGFYVDPGKTLVLRLKIDRPGRHTFQCDLHPTMKSEVLVLEMTTA